jgi:hypothetical protein
MAGLVPAIHAFDSEGKTKDVDARHKAGHDESVIMAVDLSFLKDKQLEMLCFAAYSLHVHLGDGIIITVEGSFEHILGKGKKRSQYYSFPIESSQLMRLVSHYIHGVNVEDDQTLHLEFSNGDKLVIKGDNGPYESYQIRHKGGQIVVSSGQGAAADNQSGAN